MDREEKLAVRMALGRIFSLLMRPAEPGDVEQYVVAKGADWDAVLIALRGQGFAL